MNTHSSEHDARLEPIFDVVTTSIYKFSRDDGGDDLEDRTMALKLTTEELPSFGRNVFGVSGPEQALARIGDSMTSVFHRFRGDERIPANLLRDMGEAWAGGLSGSSLYLVVNRYKV